LSALALAFTIDIFMVVAVVTVELDVLAATNTELDNLEKNRT
jgi:hypothetical protein